MKLLYPKLRRLCILLMLLAGNVLLLPAQDVPGASPTLQTAPAGTLVIAMDHTNQATSVINAASGTYLFNLKAYGLVTLFRNCGVNINWVIKTGKAKDGIDFSANAERMYPDYAAAQSLDFKAGPFVIFPSDTLGAAYVINWFNNWVPDSCKVKVYRLIEDVDVDVRYTLTNPPRIALLHDSCDIHRNYMEMASVPTVNYDCIPNASGLISGCYTMVTVPHMVTSDLTSYDADSIYNFVMAGGNFLGECESVETFETKKNFQSSSGAIADPTGGQYNNFNNNVYFDNPDMAYAQYQGTFRPWLRGAQKVWRFSSSNTNNFYSVTSCKRNGGDNLYYVASVSKLISGQGGMSFYLGNHEYYTYDCHTCLSSNSINEEEINGIRLYLNATQIPTTIIPCVALDVKLGDFTATKQSNETVLLKWNTLSEINNDYFIIEHSTDGRRFTPVGKQFSNGNNSSNYSYIHAEPRNGINYYRLRSVDKNSKATYSSIRKVVFGKTDLILTIFPNPAKNSTTLMINTNDDEKLFVKLIDGAARIVKQQVITIKAQLGELDLRGINNGLYIIIAKTENGDQFKTKIIVKK